MGSVFKYYILTYSCNLNPFKSALSQIVVLMQFHNYCEWLYKLSAHLTAGLNPLKSSVAVMQVNPWGLVVALQGTAITWLSVQEVSGWTTCLTYSPAFFRFILILYCIYLLLRILTTLNIILYYCAALLNLYVRMCVGIEKSVFNLLVILSASWCLAVV